MGFGRIDRRFGRIDGRRIRFGRLSRNTDESDSFATFASWAGRPRSRRSPENQRPTLTGTVPKV